MADPEIVGTAGLALGGVAGLALGLKTAPDEKAVGQQPSLITRLAIGRGAVEFVLTAVALIVVVIIVLGDTAHPGNIHRYNLTRAPVPSRQ